MSIKFILTFCNAANGLWNFFDDRLQEDQLPLQSSQETFRRDRPDLFRCLDKKGDTDTSPFPSHGQKIPDLIAAPVPQKDHAPSLHKQPEVDRLQFPKELQ